MDTEGIERFNALAKDMYEANAILTRDIIDREKRWRYAEQEVARLEADLYIKETELAAAHSECRALKARIDTLEAVRNG